MNLEEASFDATSFTKNRERLLAHDVSLKFFDAVVRRTTRHASYAISQRIRKRVEEIFGWFKTVGGLRKTRFKGIARTQEYTFMVGAAYNPLRMSKLAPIGAVT